MFLKILFINVIVFLLLSGCRNKQDNITLGKVHIEEKEGKYTLFRNGQPYAIRGAAGSTHLSLLKEIGGNSIRIWDTTNLATVLDSARANQIAVIVGFHLPDSDDKAFYNNPGKVARMHMAFKAIVNRFKANPAVLMWCVGNELNFPHGLAYLNFYEAFNDLTNMIHRDDPDHPVTTTIINFNPKYIFNIVTRCEIDIISFNIFSKIQSFREDLKDFSWFWKGPYMFTEWGINGPWLGTELTAWGAYIEASSKKKAAIYSERYKTYIPFEDPRFLGSFVFFWGSKQETTHTWFSMFDETGASSEAVASMKYFWSGKSAPYKLPQLENMLVNNKSGMDNILLKPSDLSTAELSMSKTSGNIKKVNWQIFSEDWHKEDKLGNTKKLIPLKNLIKSKRDLSVTFTAPSAGGPYRIFATVYDQYGNFATCNTPFYVVSDK